MGKDGSGFILTVFSVTELFLSRPLSTHYSGHLDN